MTTDPLLLVGLIMLGMAMGALLMKIWFTSAAKKLVDEEIMRAASIRPVSASPQSDHPA